MEVVEHEQKQEQEVEMVDMVKMGQEDLAERYELVIPISKGRLESVENDRKLSEKKHSLAQKSIKINNEYIKLSDQKKKKPPQKKIKKNYLIYFLQKFSSSSSSSHYYT